MDKKTLISKLERISLCKGMDQKFYDAFVPILSIKGYSQGHRIIHEGDTGTEMYFLIQGTVRIIKKTISGDEYTAVLLKDEYGIFFGEVGLISADNRSASVVAENHCEIAVLKAEEFDRFVDAYPEYGAKFLKALAGAICQKLKKSNHDTVVLYEALINEIGQGLV
jgi:CRP-like cAMP-binding protein